MVVTYLRGELVEDHDWLLHLPHSNESMVLTSCWGMTVTHGDFVIYHVLNKFLWYCRDRKGYQNPPN